MLITARAANELLVSVLAAGVNNNEIDVRLRWHSSSMAGSSENLSIVH